ncbi:unnamed protein product, partial [Brenthis ino]
MQRPTNNPMMTCGLPGRQQQAPANNNHFGPRLMPSNMGTCFGPVGHTHQVYRPSPCFMSMSNLRTTYPNQTTPSSRYDPCFK